MSLKLFKKDEHGFSDVLKIAMVLAVLGVLGMVSMYINEKVADKTALTSTDHFFNASEDVIDSVETGYDFMEILVIVIVAAVIIGLLLTVMPIRF